MPRHTDKNSNRRIDNVSPTLTSEAAFAEVFENEPAIVAKTRRKSGAKRAHKQKVAIALSKAGLSRSKKKRKKFTSRTRF